MRINKKLFPPWTVPIFLLLLAFINFGLHCNSVGFYFDDLPFLWLTKLRGISSITELDPGRPLSGWLLMLGVRIFGYKPLYWQAFSAFGRWLSAVGLWWMVLQLYPKRVYTATLISVIFLVYPGFGHQYIPVNSSRHIYPYALTVVSMGFMLLGVRSSCLRRWLFVLISFILAAVSMLTTDYYYGLELLRPVLIWVVLSEKFKNLKQRFIETIKIWSPFLLLVFVFYLRRSLHKEYYQVGIFGSLLEGGLLSSLFILSQTIFQDLIEVSLIAWERVVQIQELISLDTPSDKLFTLFFFVAFFLTVIYFLKLKVTKLYNQDSYSIKSNIQMAFVGAWALLVAGLPMWLIPLLIRLDFPENRFTLPLALGVSILFVSVLKLFVKNRAKQIIIVGVAIGFATSSHFQLAKSFKTERHLQKEFI
ncbi:MAG: hypothetical protein U9Q82_02935, partial [Chloroflexota bacterium]|nr:hypothetical protein [Chloroflexota bacterium]